MVVAGRIEDNAGSRPVIVAGLDHKAVAVMGLLAYFRFVDNY